MARTIESPGVEIKERDLSLTANLPVGTNIFVQGFAAQGPTDELLNVTSVSEFEQIYGLPTNAAERYLYQTCSQVLQSPGNLLVTRFPYGTGDGTGYGNQYTALLYPMTGTLPVSSYDFGLSATVWTDTATLFTAATSYTIGVPTLITLTDAEYTMLRNNNISWPASGSVVPATVTHLSDLSASNTGLIIVNDYKTTVDDGYQGYYVVVGDNTGLSDTTYDKVRAIEYSDPGTNTWTDIPETKLQFSLSSDGNGSSISKDFEATPNWSDFYTTAYQDCLVVGLFKLRNTLFGDQPTTSIDEILCESYYGSLWKSRQFTPQTGGIESGWLPTRINSRSTFMSIAVNPEISNNAWGDPPVRKVTLNTVASKAYAIGPTTLLTDVGTKAIGDIPSKLTRSLRLAENFEQIPIDVVCDGGLSTIWTSTRVLSAVHPTDTKYQLYDDTVYLPGVTESGPATVTGYLADPTDGTSSDVQNAWETVYNLFANFASTTRKDCLFIADALRNIFVQGYNGKVLNDTTKNFSEDVYWPLKNLVAAANSNYSCVYGNWVRMYDNNAADYVWMPFSGFEASIMATVDSNLQPWFAAAGLNNGVVKNAVDIGINPTQKQRDLLYRVSVNPVVFFPGDGYVVWCQKTLQKRPSAFDRINVRRLFLVLEKATMAVMRYFVFEPNTIFTRTRVVNVLKPIFDIAKNNEGVYDYLIVCDERNNTPQVTDNNELVVDIYIKPVRTAEFILVNFIATRTDQSFNELL